ncbi:drug/metabolite transporter (DMT)-like permease [Iodobacter fluviatilis]|uniref:Drug/metabolite transporter (DMT)-like permease n=2 Tax=Iodobacter fluviatilis TaxID=537 RepID=A0A377Q5Y5_9NEIS|nr:drug/metabolite transporter (DMT)-like permease [Iodobacter fluviatilis]STQ90165.1 putative DMT superfamily transporter inner membrane protein [Iodobacter fluviatilis]
MALALESIPPLAATGLRFLLTCPLLVFLARYNKVSLGFPLGRRWLLPVVAIGYFAVPFWLMIFGEAYVSSGLAAVIFANMPIAVMLASILFLKERFSFLQYLGLLLAIGCLIKILFNETALSDGQNWIGIVFLALAVVIHAVLYVVVRQYCQGIHVITYNAVPSGVAAVLLILASIFIEMPDVSAFSARSCGAVAYLGLVAGVGGILAYFKLNEKATPFKASICFLVFPLIALFLDNQIKNNNLSGESLALLIPLLLGIMLTKSSYSKLNLNWLVNYARYRN